MTGDLVRVTVHGDSEEETGGLLEALASSEEIAERLIPIPTLTRRAGDGEFGGVELVQEFIIAASAQVTAESLIAAVRAFLSHRRRHQNSEPPPVAQVTVTIAPDGVVELAIRVEPKP